MLLKLFSMMLAVRLASPIFKTYALEDQEDQTKWRKVFRMIHIKEFPTTNGQNLGFGFSGYIFPLVVSQTYMKGYYNIRKTSL